MGTPDQRTNRMDQWTDGFCQQPLVLLDVMTQLTLMGCMNRMTSRACATNNCTDYPFRVEESNVLRGGMGRLFEKDAL